MLKIIKAAAGSGKTYTLTLEYITMLLGERDEATGELRLVRKTGRHPREYHRHIVAMTFTNKATEEMKQRIVLELSILAGMRPGVSSSYTGELCKLFKTTSDEVAQAAKTALTELLFDYTNFNVHTIDTFFQTVLRTFASEADKPFDYEIELDDDYLLRVGIHDFLSEVNSNHGKNDQTIGWIERYVDSQLSTNSEWNPYKKSDDDRVQTMFSLASVINKEFYRTICSEMEAYLTGPQPGKGKSPVELFQETVWLHLGQAQGAFLRYMREADNAITSSPFAASRMKNRCVAPSISKALVKGFTVGSDSKYIATLEKYHNDEDAFIFKAPLRGNAEATEVHNRVRELCGKAIHEWEKAALCRGIAANVFVLGLIGRIGKCITNFRDENNLILLSDTNELLRGIISERDTPFIYERIGTYVNNFLIDEFQDTSSMQWDNLKPLLTHSLASGNENLIIGDVKQCIYRFRNSDPSLLQYQVEQDSRLHGFISGSSDKSFNWRSSPVVIKFNNTLFSHFAGLAGLTDVYSNVIQRVNNKPWPAQGCVRIYMDQPAGRDKKDSQETTQAAGEAQTVSVETRVADLICGMVDRGYRQGDIAILVNKNSEGSTIIESLLKYNQTVKHRHDIKVVSNESLLLAKSPSIRLIISHLRYLAVSETLQEQPGEITSIQARQELLHRHLRQYERHVNAGMQPSEALTKCFEAPGDNSDISSLIPKEKDAYSLVTLVGRIIVKVLSDDARKIENPFIQAFQDVVTDFCSTNNASIGSFLRWWDNCGRNLSITSPAGTDAVNVMTIHKSKGLEFPCVIIPYATWEIGRTEKLEWIPRADIAASGIFQDISPEMIPPLTPVPSSAIPKKSALRKNCDAALHGSVVDCMNKTYVAFTRAINELHIFSCAPSGPLPDLSTESAHLNSYMADFLAKHSAVATASLNASFAQSVGLKSADIAVSPPQVIDEGTGAVCYQFGSIMNNPKPAKEEEKIELMPDYEAVDTPVKAEYETPQVFYNARQMEGTMLHRILSKIRYADDADRALLFAKTRGIIPAGPASKEQEVSGIIKGMLTQNDEVGSWFDRRNEVYNEAPIIDGPTRYRPDRIVVTPGGETIVIDYKFGEPHNSYRKQVGNYMELLARAGFGHVTGRIWYPLTGKITRLTLPEAR